MKVQVGDVVETAEGVAEVASLRSETYFVARYEDGLQLLKRVTDILPQQGADLEEPEEGEDS